MRTYNVYFFRPGGEKLIVEQIVARKPSEAMARISGPIDMTRGIGYFGEGRK